MTMIATMQLGRKLVEEKEKRSLLYIKKSFIARVPKVYLGFTSALTCSYGNIN